MQIDAIKGILVFPVARKLAEPQLYKAKKGYESSLIEKNSLDEFITSSSTVPNKKLKRISLKATKNIQAIVDIKKITSAYLNPK